MGDIKDKSGERGGLLCPTSRQPAINHEAEMEAAAGLPGTSKTVESELRRDGIDPDRLSILNLGRPAALLHYPYPPWLRRMGTELALCVGRWIECIP